MQYFKGDEAEIKYYMSARPSFQLIDLQKDIFFEEAYQAYPLGDLVYDNARAPLANAISRNIFRESFSEIVDAFIVAGTYESYLTVFRKIFGEDVQIIFNDWDSPNDPEQIPGKLKIDIIASGLELSDFVARSIVDNQYIFDEVVDHEGDNIAFQTVKGFQTQYELEQMLFEMVPAGVWTDINLTIGEE